MERRKLGLLAIAGIAALLLTAALATVALAQEPTPGGRQGPAAACPMLQGGASGCTAQGEGGACPMLGGDAKAGSCPLLQDGAGTCPVQGEQGQNGAQGSCPIAGQSGRGMMRGMGGMMRGMMGGMMRGRLMGPVMMQDGSCPFHPAQPAPGDTL